MKIELWLINPNFQVCQALKKGFQSLPFHKVIQCRFQDLESHDCFVTAGNSFGMMNAGIDAAVIAFHGHDLMKRIQHRIIKEYLGEQPVGTCFIESTNNPEYPFVAHAPTMRVPSGIDGTDNVYKATWAALIAINQHNVAQKLNENKQIKSVVFPAMGAGFGGVSPHEVARQMALAYKNCLHPPDKIDWDFIAARNKAILHDGNKRVVK